MIVRSSGGAAGGRWWPVAALAVALAPAAPWSRTAAAEGRVAATAEARLKADVTFLADDAREGRAPGTDGIEAAADYIANVFKDAGLAPAAGADGYFQRFSILGDPR